MKSRKLIGITVLALVSSLAFAGAVQPASVEIVVNADGSGSASGDMVTARTSDDDLEFIGCGIKGFVGGGFPSQFGFCQAGNSEVEFVVCFTTKVHLLEVMKGTAVYSFIRFIFDEDGECTRIDFSTQSLYVPSNVTGNQAKRKNRN